MTCSTRSIIYFFWSTFTGTSSAGNILHTDQISTESRFLQSVYCTTRYTAVVYRTAKLVLGPKTS